MQGQLRNAQLFQTDELFALNDESSLPLKLFLDIELKYQLILVL